MNILVRSITPVTILLYGWFQFKYHTISIFLLNVYVSVVMICMYIVMTIPPFFPFINAFVFL